MERGGKEEHSRPREQPVARSQGGRAPGVSEDSEEASAAGLPEAVQGRGGRDERRGDGRRPGGLAGHRQRQGAQTPPWAAPFRLRRLPGHGPHAPRAPRGDVHLTAHGVPGRVASPATGHTRPGHRGGRGGTCTSLRSVPARAPPPSPHATPPPARRQTRCHLPLTGRSPTSAGAPACLQRPNQTKSREKVLETRVSVAE